MLNGGTYKGKNAVVTNSLPYKTVGEEGSAEGDEITCKSASTTIQDAVIEGDATGVVGFANSTVTLKNTTVSAHGHALLASGGTEDVSFLMTGGSLTSADGTVFGAAKILAVMWNQSPLRVKRLLQRAVPC